MLSRIEEFDHLVASSSDLVLVEVGDTRGSTPREKGTWMMVSLDQIFETIGGGQLEFDAIESARKILSTKSEFSKELTINLGPETGQCCGGVVMLQLQLADEKCIADTRERLLRETDSQPCVYIFGAGHVGLALASALAVLPFSTVLVDTRKEQIESAQVATQKRWTAIPEAEVRDAPPGSAYVVLTHDHALDFLIAREALAREDAAYVGMIGSKTKRATFRNWLKRESGIAAGVQKLVCPIGKSSVADKRPQIIAALVVAEIIETLLVSKEIQPDAQSSSIAAEAT